MSRMAKQKRKLIEIASQFHANDPLNLIHSSLSHFEAIENIPRTPRLCKYFMRE